MPLYKTKYNPLAFTRPDPSDYESGEEPMTKTAEIKHCKTAASMFKDISNPLQILHRVIHLYQRLKRIDVREEPEIEMRKKPIYKLVYEHIADSLCKVYLEQSFHSANTRQSANEQKAPTSTNSQTMPIVTEENIPAMAQPLVTQTPTSPLANSTVHQPSQNGIQHTQFPVLNNLLNPPIYTIANDMQPMNTVHNSVYASEANRNPNASFTVTTNSIPLMNQTRHIPYTEPVHNPHIHHRNS